MQKRNLNYKSFYVTIIQHLDDKFRFGKFRGSTLGEVLMYNPEYLCWIVNTIRGHLFVLEDSAVDEIRLIFPYFPITETFEEMRLIQKDEFYFNRHNLNYIDSCIETTDSIFSTWEEEPTYERYNGSYAQDVMGFSDDEIDTIFDGDPLAYWNID